jgi:ABC-type branched-subunit amino acid transport system substrate-binding protein
MKAPIPRALLASVLVLAACTRSRVPGVSDSEVVLGMSAPLSGPAAAWGSLSAGARAWAAHVNAEGGVEGRQIKVIVKDDGYTPSRAVGNLTEMKDSVFAIVGLLGTAVVNATKDLVAEAEIPVVFPTANPRLWAGQKPEDLRRVFVVYPDYDSEGAYMAERLAHEVKAKTVAVFYQNDDYGKEGLGGLRRAAAGAGLAVTAAVPYELQDREMSLQAVTLKQSGADAVVLFSTTTHGANVVKEMAKLGYRPALYASFVLADHYTMFRLLGELYEGAFFDTFLPLVGEPGTEEILKVLLAIDPSLKGREGFALLGALEMMLTVEGLERAGRDLTRESFVAALEGVREWKPLPGLAPVSFGPGRRHGQNSLRLVRAGRAADLSFSVLTEYRSFAPLF